MAKEPDYYGALGVSRDATLEEIRRAYHLAARQYHPDVNVEAGETQLFLDVQQAYEVLSNPKKRSAYDATLPPYVPPPSPASISTIFSRSHLTRIKEPQVVYTLVELEAPPGAPRVNGPPINVCLILDCSTSMQGDRLDTVKLTAIELTRQLRPVDTLSIVTFSDKAEVLLPAGKHPTREELETLIQMIHTNGATEVFKGLEAGYFQVRRNLRKNQFNHILLLTDGHTYGDELACLQIADQAMAEGVVISALGIGEEWNDTFLDKLTSTTGGTTTYVSQTEEIRKFLKQKFSGFSETYAERVGFNFSLLNGVQLHYAFRLAPESSPLQTSSPMLLGSIPYESSLSFLLEFRVLPLPANINQVMLAKGLFSFDIPSQPEIMAPSNFDLVLPVSDSPQPEAPSPSLVQAISKLNLYRMQERAYKELADGRMGDASQHLQNLATHLFAQGEHDLARTTLREAELIEQGEKIGEEGKKRIKYGTRALLLPGSVTTHPLDTVGGGEL
jgi:Ca-activated chloride channel family protein